MAATINTYVPGKRPKHFAPFSVDFIGPEGEELTIPGVVFKYRTRKEFGALIDKHNADSANTYQPGKGEAFSMEAFLESLGKNIVGLLAESIEAWGLEDVPASREQLEQLVDETPAAAIALQGAYTAAARDGRLGNL